MSWPRPWPRTPRQASRGAAANGCDSTAWSRPKWTRRRFYLRLTTQTWWHFSYQRYLENRLRDKFEFKPHSSEKWCLRPSEPVQFFPIIFCLPCCRFLAAGVVAALLIVGGQSTLGQIPGGPGPCHICWGQSRWDTCCSGPTPGWTFESTAAGGPECPTCCAPGAASWAAVTLTMDIAKGALAVILARQLIGSTGAEAAAGILVLAGHNWPVFLQFKGGRGILTGLGGLSVMAPFARRHRHRVLPAYHLAQQVHFPGFHYRSDLWLQFVGGPGAGGYVLQHLRPVRNSRRGNHHLAAPGQHPADSPGRRAQTRASRPGKPAKKFPHPPCCRRWRGPGSKPAGLQRAGEHRPTRVGVARSLSKPRWHCLERSASQSFSGESLPGFGRPLVAVVGATTWGTHVGRPT